MLQSRDTPRFSKLYKDCGAHGPAWSGLCGSRSSGTISPRKKDAGDRDYVPTGLQESRTGSSPPGSDSRLDATWTSQIWTHQASHFPLYTEIYICTSPTAEKTPIPTLCTKVNVFSLDSKEPQTEITGINV